MSVYCSIQDGAVLDASSCEYVIYLLLARGNKKRGRKTLSLSLSRWSGFKCAQQEVNRKRMCWRCAMGSLSYATSETFYILNYCKIQLKYFLTGFNSFFYNLFPCKFSKKRKARNHYKDSTKSSCSTLSLVIADPKSRKLILRFAKHAKGWKEISSPLGTCLTDLEKRICINFQCNFMLVLLNQSMECQQLKGFLVLVWLWENS